MKEFLLSNYLDIMIIFVDKVALLMSEHCNFFGRRCAILPPLSGAVRPESMRGKKKSCHDSRAQPTFHLMKLHVRITGIVAG